MENRAEAIPVPLTAEEEAFLRAFARAMQAVPHALDTDLMYEQGMSMSEYTALMHLSEAPGRRLRMSDLADQCTLSLSGMTRVVGRLESHGLVRRERCDSDGRGLNAVLTDAGLDRLRRAWPTHLASVRRHLIDHLRDIDLPAVTAAVRCFATSPSCLPAQHEPGDPADEPASGSTSAITSGSSS